MPRPGVRSFVLDRFAAGRSGHFDRCRTNIRYLHLFGRILRFADQLPIGFISAGRYSPKTFPALIEQVGLLTLTDFISSTLPLVSDRPRMISLPFSRPRMMVAVQLEKFASKSILAMRAPLANLETTVRV